jgi:hypothetical protein
MPQASKSWKPSLLSALTLLALAVAVPICAAEREIYPAPTQADADLVAALKTAAATHKLVNLDFGGDCCPFRQALDIHFRDAKIGRADQYPDMASRFEIAISKGVLALAE